MPIDSDVVERIFDQLEKINDKIDDLPRVYVIKEVFELVKIDLEKRVSRLEDGQSGRFDRWVSRIAIVLSGCSTFYVLIHYVKW